MVVACGSVSAGPGCAEGAGAGGAWPARMTSAAENSRSAAVRRRHLIMARLSLHGLVDQKVRRRNDEDGQENRSRQTADDGLSHRGILLGARAQLERHGNHSD